MKKNIIILLAAMAAIGLFGGFAHAEEFSANITTNALITDSQAAESPRLLLYFQLPEDFSGKAIRSARLYIPLSIDISDSSLANLTIWPLGMSWGPDNVSWTYPWSQVGGSVADSNYALYATPDGSPQTMDIDISTIAFAWSQGWFANNGLLVMLLQGDRHTLQLEENAEWPSGAVARVEIVYED
jgi:hypothetical protein